MVISVVDASRVIPSSHTASRTTHVLEERVPADALEEVVGLALRLDHLAGLHAVLADGMVEHLPVAALLRSPGDEFMKRTHQLSAASATDGYIPHQARHGPCSRP